MKREPIVVGKPAEFMLANIAAQFGLQRGQICMVGDRLDTDILFGQQGGLSTLLVLSGAAPRSGAAAGEAEGLWGSRGPRAQSALLGEPAEPAWQSAAARGRSARGSRGDLHAVHDSGSWEGRCR